MSSSCMSGECKLAVLAFSSQFLFFFFFFLSFQYDYYTLGFKGVAAFEQNLNYGYLPKESSIEYEGKYDRIRFLAFDRFHSKYWLSGRE